MLGPGSMKRLFAEAEARAAEIRQSLKYCGRCGRTMLPWPGRTIHFSCEPGTLAGKRCSCPPGCTKGDNWGDGPRECDAGCEPCRTRQGQPLRGRKR